MTSIQASSVITIGVDPHPGRHTAATLNEHGRLLESITVDNDAAGLAKLKCFSSKFKHHRWAIEGAGNSYIYPFVRDCLKESERVYGITPNLKSQYRRRGNNPKDDETDAVNAARALLANPQLEAYTPIKAQCQAQQLTRQQRRLSQQLKANRMALKELADTKLKASIKAVIKALKKAFTELNNQLKAMVKEHAYPLLNPPGIGPVVAGILLAEVGLASRFRSRDAFATYAGCAPLSRQSGKRKQVRVNYKGNRRLNYAIHIIALSRMHRDEKSQILLTRKRQEGHSQRKAIRVLKIYIARELYQLLKQLELKPLFQSSLS